MIKRFMVAYRPMENSFSQFGFPSTTCSCKSSSGIISNLCIWIVNSSSGITLIRVASVNGIWRGWSTGRKMPLAGMTLKFLTMHTTPSLIKFWNWIHISGVVDACTWVFWIYSKYKNIRNCFHVTDNRNLFVLPQNLTGASSIWLWHHLVLSKAIFL